MTTREQTIIVLQCDGGDCDVEFESDESTDENRARWFARQDGWGFLHGRDYCDEHRVPERTTVHTNSNEGRT